MRTTRCGAKPWLCGGWSPRRAHSIHCWSRASLNWSMSCSPTSRLARRTCWPWMPAPWRKTTPTSRMPWRRSSLTFIRRAASARRRHRKHRAQGRATSGPAHRSHGCARCPGGCARHTHPASVLPDAAQAPGAALSGMLERAVGRRPRSGSVGAILQCRNDRNKHVKAAAMETQTLAGILQVGPLEPFMDSVCETFCAAMNLYKVRSLRQLYHCVGVAVGAAPWQMTTKGPPVLAPLCRGEAGDPTAISLFESMMSIVQQVAHFLVEAQALPGLVEKAAQVMNENAYALQIWEPKSRGL